MLGILLTMGSFPLFYVKRDRISEWLTLRASAGTLYFVDCSVSRGMQMKNTQLNLSPTVPNDRILFKMVVAVTLLIIGADSLVRRSPADGSADHSPDLILR